MRTREAARFTWTHKATSSPRPARKCRELDNQTPGVAQGRHTTRPQPPLLQKAPSSHHLISKIVLVALATVAPALSQPTALRESVQLDHATILLSDLLPQNASDPLRSRTATIALGHALQPGAVRILPNHELEQLLRHNPLLNEISIPQQIAIRRQTWPIADESVRDAISHYLDRMHWDLSPEILHWDPTFGATQPFAPLEVTTAGWNASSSSMEFHLRCAGQRACRSFLVTAAIGGRPFIPAARSKPPILVAPGTLATLTSISGRVHVSLKVVPLQRGALGQIVRVRDPLTRKIFQVRVTGEAALSPVLQ